LLDEARASLELPPNECVWSVLHFSSLNAARDQGFRLEEGADRDERYGSEPLNQLEARSAEFKLGGLEPVSMEL
jgi:hypothetical protein